MIMFNTHTHTHRQRNHLMVLPVSHGIALGNHSDSFAERLSYQFKDFSSCNWLNISRMVRCVIWQNIMKRRTCTHQNQCYKIMAAYVKPLEIQFTLSVVCLCIGLNQCSSVLSWRHLFSWVHPHSNAFPFHFENVYSLSIFFGQIDYFEYCSRFIWILFVRVAGRR